MASVEERIERLAALLRRARRTVVLTGAGMSTESGIPDFRGAGGLWRRYDATEVAHLRTFHRDPALLWRFYRERLQTVRGARPNAGHHALAELERGGRVHALVTQNVDGLHRQAGSDPIEVHGSLTEAVCLRCGERVPMGEAERRLDGGAEVPLCVCGAPLKPGVVLFGELLPEAAVERAQRAAAACDLLIAAGTSLEVWPVAELPLLAAEGGAAVAILNLGPTALDDRSDLRLQARLGEALPRLAAAVA
jgi:NAD-dependent deacetylase